ncbi:MAG TPA: hypothetical protein VK576_09530, partial [Thermoleophilia bacterium]|nr:hypothetical protein [Thermoleophilia bacterium]
ARPSPFSEEECAYHWVELLYEGSVIERHLAARFEGARVSLPAPLFEPSGGEESPRLWVSERAYRLLRLANQVDPDSGDFDACFAASGIELR